VSRITRGKVELKRVPVDMADVIAKAVEMTSPAIDDRQHTLRVDVPPDLATEGDPARLAQVFANLLANAAKYTEPRGQIRVWAERDDSHLTVAVADNGCGIAPDVLPDVFDLFAQGRQDVERAAGGLGLGLAIVRSLVEAHGGSVSAASPGRNQGATFTVRLPATQSRRVSQPVSENARAPADDGVRILLVDDNRDAAELLADSLRALGHVVTVEHDGPGALAAAGHLRPDVALLDLGLPVMDGFELADQLRQCGRLNSLQLVAITGYAQDTDRDRTRAHGFAAHRAKPIDVHELDDLVRRLAAER
jgi:CheY-like chemotaxis protein/two-component sensor histidine kinase